MEIYVTKKKNNLIRKAKTKEPYSFYLNFHEHGYVVQKSFKSFSDICDLLIKEKIYKQEYFPKDLLNMEEFIMKGFSIYY